MQFQLIILSLLFSVSALAVAEADNKAIKELFERHDQIGNKSKKEEVFTKEFLKDNDLGASFEKDMKKNNEKIKPVPYDLIVKPALHDKNMMFVKRKFKDEKEDPHSSYILIKKNGKWLIEGTISDID